MSEPPLRNLAQTKIVTFGSVLFDNGPFASGIEC